MRFSIFLRILLKTVENSLASVGGSAPDPLLDRPPKVFSPNRNPGGAAVMIHSNFSNLKIFL